MSLRKTKESFIIQGVIHVESNKEYFKDLPELFYPFLTEGIQNGLTDNLLNELLHVSH